ncbi:MAG: ATP-binding protein [Acidobacteriota bacterium]|nr:ATP-binding protein [Acidobacteriota bacterium]
MFSPRLAKNKTDAFAPGQAGTESSSSSSSAELRFIAELGRSLLFTFHPKKVASRVAEALREEVEADVCALVVELETVGFVTSAFDSGDSETNDFLHKNRFKKWLEFLPPQISVWTEDEGKFLLGGKNHKFEYVSPVHINGQVKGAVIVGFAEKNLCDERARRLIDAATQMAAMSVNLSAHYEARMDASINQAKEQHRKFTEMVLDALPVSLYVIDKDYKIVTWNRNREIGSQGVPREEVIGRNVFEVLTKYPQSELSQEFERAFRTGKIERIEQRTTDSTGATKHWMVSKIPMRDSDTGNVTHVITVGEDVTVRVEAIHAVGRAEKLAAVGRLASGVVHEINNPLATISACAEALETRVSEGVFDVSPEVEDLREYLSLIRSEAFRCKTITNGLLDFSRVRAGNRTPIDMGLTVKSSARLIAHQKRGDNIEIKLEIDENLPAVNADEGQMQQAVIALSTNAIDAMPGGGTLTLRAAAQNGRVVVEVQDTGHGIAPEDLPKVFEPFFTTKEIGKGTGLGLAVCYGIVTEHGGRLAVRSNVGVGTTFTMYLPIHKEQS